MSNEILNMLSNNTLLLNIFYKLFLIVTSIIYFFYSMVIMRQVETMLNFIRRKGYKILLVICKVQIILSVIIFFISILI